MSSRPRYPGIRVTANGNQLVSYHTETRIADAGIFYPITPSTEGGELYQQAYAEGKLNVFGGNTIAVEAEGEHAAQGGAIALLRVRQARRQLHVRAGRRVRRGAVLPRAGQVLDDGAGGGGARADQARAQRALRPRRHLRRARHRLDHGLRKGRPAGGRPGAHPAAGYRAEPHARHEHPGRLPDVASRTDVLQARVRAHSRVSSVRPTTSSSVRPKASGCCSVRSAAACRK